MKKWKTVNKIKNQKSREDIIRILLENRGVRTKKEMEEFLDPKLEEVTLENVGIDQEQVKKAIFRIEKAIEKNEKIIIYGDYDVDGISGTAILWETIYKSYKNVIPYVPHRVNEGYGLSSKGISNIKSQISNVKLIITVDNGIVANEAVEFANKNGIDVVITDHHVCSDKDPDAFAIIHTTKLCGAGVAYLLAQEIQNSKFKIQNYNSKVKSIDAHLELAALATVADLVPLIGPSRAIVKFGIDALRKTKRPGLLALFERAKIKKEEIGVYEIGHIISPRLNATGRISHALDSLRLICTKDKNRAESLADSLDETNKNRRLVTEESTIHADLLLKQAGSNQKFIFIHNKNYNQGVIGLIASRLVETYYRPAVVVSEGEIYSKGSARSIAGFNMIAFLRGFKHLLVDAGGHPMAAGFTIETGKIEEFKTALIQHAGRVISDKILEKTLKIDTEIDFSIISQDLYQEIQKLAPFGMGNPQPLFVSRKVIKENMRFVGDGKHVKFSLSQEGSEVFDAIAFGAGETDFKFRIGDKIDIVYSIEKDEWNGREKIQLKIRDFKNN